MKRRPPAQTAYAPGSDGALALWLDASITGTGSIQNTGGGAITNGATVGKWIDQTAAARQFIQWGSNTRPTYDATALGLGAIKCAGSAQILTTQTGVAAFNSLSGLTILTVNSRNTATGGTIFGLTQLDSSTGFHDISLALLRQQNVYEASGRRTTSDANQTFTGDTAPVSNISGVVFDYAHALAQLFENGTEGPTVVFQATGTTAATEPYAFSVGGFAQQSALAASTLMDGWIGEVLVWAAAMTPDQLVLPHNYLRRKWGLS